MKLSEIYTSIFFGSSMLGFISVLLNFYLPLDVKINSIIFICVKHRADGKCQIYLVKGYTNILDSCDANLILECDSREVDNILADRLVLCKLVSTRVGKVNVFLALNYEAGEHHPGIPYIYQHIDLFSPVKTQ